MKAGKKIMIIAGCFFAAIALFICFSAINHSIRLKKEEPLREPIGQLVEVNGAKMNVYTEGSGEKTLIFLSGGGTCSPVLDFKSLYSLLGDDYRIVVIEKFGYGFSDIIDTPRDIDSVLEASREALRQAGIDGPFVLCPHSLSGIESLYWAQKYPDEIEAIIGLDMALPSAYEGYPISMFGVRLGQFGARIGITRFIPKNEISSAIKHGTLTDKEKEIYCAVFYSRTATSTMIEELKNIKQSAAKVGSGDMPQVPMLMFVSNGSGTGWDTEKWQNYQLEFAEGKDNIQTVMLDCGHYVHDYEYERISEEIKAFLG